MKRKRCRGRRAVLTLLREGSLPHETNLKGRGLEHMAMKDLYAPGEPVRESPVPWNGMGQATRDKAEKEFQRLHQITRHRRSLRVEAAVPRELALTGDGHRSQDLDPGEHAPIPRVPAGGELTLLTQDQQTMLLGLTLYVPYRRFMRKARVSGLWKDLSFQDLQDRMNESVGLVLHLFQRVDDRTFVVAFRMDVTGRYYVALVFRPVVQGDRGHNLLGNAGPYQTYFFTCTCQ